MLYDVIIQQQEVSALFDIKGSADELRNWLGDDLPAMPDRPNSRTIAGNQSLYHVGPNCWLLRGDRREEEKLETSLRPCEAPSSISIVNISDAMTFFQIAGPDAEQIMSIACPLDLYPTNFIIDSACYSEVFGIKALIMKQGDDFEFAVDQSFAAMIHDHLNRANHSNF